MDILEDMQHEQQQEKEPQKQQEKEYLLPDGFGMSLDEIRALILNKYDIKVDKDDPILMIIPILNACLHEQQKLQEEYKEGLKLVYQEVLEEFAGEIDKKLAAASVVVRQESKYEEHRRTVYVLYTLVVVLSFVLITIYFWKF